MELLIVVQNLGRGGLKTGSGDPQDRWPLLTERLMSAGPPTSGTDSTYCPALSPPVHQPESGRSSSEAPKR